MNKSGSKSERAMNRHRAEFEAAIGCKLWWGDVDDASGRVAHVSWTGPDNIAAAVDGVALRFARLGLKPVRAEFRESDGVRAVFVQGAPA